MIEINLIYQRSRYNKRLLILETNNMSEKKFLQKVSKVCAITSFIIALISLLYFLIFGDELSEVLRASLGATIFFFFMVGIVLMTMANTNLPDFKIPKE